jgi:scyllo-inositol 2-dehydrogenase (NADP+)
VQAIRVGIVGFGRIGNEHAGWLSRCAGIEPVAVFDPTTQRREKAGFLGLKTFDSLDQMLAGDVDAVLISTPTAMHAEHAAAALRAGKHVMVEKPVTLDLPQAQRLLELAGEQDRVLSVFHNRRWDIDFLTVKQAIASGALGRVFNIESRLGQWGSCVGPAAREWRPGWRNEAAYGGGGLYDWGSHFVDQVAQLLLPAKPVSVFAQMTGNVWTSDCDDFSRVCINFDNGTSAMVEINTVTKRPLPRWHLDGALGSAESPFSLEFETRKWAELNFAAASGDSIERLPLADPGLTEIDIWQQFAAAIRGESAPAVPIQSVLMTMRLLDAARESAKTALAVSIRQK